MHPILKPFQLLYFVYALLTFIILMIPVFIWSLGCSFFGRIKGGNLLYYACIVWADVWCFLIFIRHKNIYLDKDDPKQSYIFVCNHQSYLDSAILPKMFRYPVRPLGKVEMKKIPLFGRIYKNAIVTVDRSSMANKIASVNLLKSFLRKGISIVVFPEGTFNETGQPVKEFYNGAFRIALETKTSIKPVLLLDTFSRMHPQSVFSFNPGKSRAVFLPAISVEGLLLDDVEVLKNRVYLLMEQALLNYKAPWIKDIG